MIISSVPYTFFPYIFLFLFLKIKNIYTLNIYILMRTRISIYIVKLWLYNLKYKWAIIFYLDVILF